MIPARRAPDENRNRTFRNSGRVGSRSRIKPKLGLRIADKMPGAYGRIGRLSGTRSFLEGTATSNYSIRTQHCYAKIELSPADINKSGDDFKQRTYLYDAHTKELLANVNQDGKKEYGMVYD